MFQMLMKFVFTYTKELILYFEIVSLRSPMRNKPASWLCAPPDPEKLNKKLLNFTVKLSIMELNLSKISGQDY